MRQTFKKSLSFIMTISIVASLFAGLGITASATPATATSVTVVGMTLNSSTPYLALNSGAYSAVANNSPTDGGSIVASFASDTGTLTVSGEITQTSNNDIVDASDALTIDMAGGTLSGGKIYSSGDLTLNFTASSLIDSLSEIDSDGNITVTCTSGTSHIHVGSGNVFYSDSGNLEFGSSLLANGSNLATVTTSGITYSSVSSTVYIDGTDVANESNVTYTDNVAYFLAEAKSGLTQAAASSGSFMVKVVKTPVFGKYNNYAVTLNNATINDACTYAGKTYAIYSDGSLSINLIGTNTVGTSSIKYGIGCSGTLSMTTAGASDSITLIGSYCTLLCRDFSLGSLAIQQAYTIADGTGTNYAETTAINKGEMYSSDGYEILYATLSPSTHGTVYYNFSPITKTSDFTVGKTYFFALAASYSDTASVASLAAGSARLKITGIDTNHDGTADSGSTNTSREQIYGDLSTYPMAYVHVVQAGTGFDTCTEGGIYYETLALKLGNTTVLAPGDAWYYWCYRGGCHGAGYFNVYSYSSVDFTSSDVNVTLKNSYTGGTTITKDDITVTVKGYTIDDYKVLDGNVNFASGDNKINLEFGENLASGKYSCDVSINPCSVTNSTGAAILINADKLGTGKVIMGDTLKASMLSTLIPSGTTPIYQWYTTSKNTADPSSDTPIASATNATFEINSTGLINDNIYCEIDVGGIKYTSNVGGPISPTAQKVALMFSSSSDNNTGSGDNSAWTNSNVSVSWDSTNKCWSAQLLTDIKVGANLPSTASALIEIADDTGKVAINFNGHDIDCAGTGSSADMNTGSANNVTFVNSDSHNGPQISTSTKKRTTTLDLTGATTTSTNEYGLSLVYSTSDDISTYEGWSWKADTKTLTLNSADIEVTSGNAIKVPDGITIVLADGSTNTATSSGVGSYGIYCAGSMTINGGVAGTGTLAALGTSAGIKAVGTYNMNGGNTSASGGTYGLYANKFGISGGTTIANGSTCAVFGTGSNYTLGYTISASLTADTAQVGTGASSQSLLYYAAHSDNYKWVKVVTTQLTNASLNSATVTFDKNTSSGNNKDITIVLTLGDYTFSKITYNSGTVFSPSNYSYVNNGDGTYTFTITKAALTALDRAAYMFVFDMNYGTDPSFAITVTDSTTSSSVGNASNDNSAKTGDGAKIGTTSATTTGTTVEFNDTQFSSVLSNTNKGGEIVIPISDSKVTSTASLKVGNVKDMAEKGVTLTVQTGAVEYKLDTTAVDTGDIMTQLGATDPASVSFSVSVTTPNSVTQSSISEAVTENGAAVVVPAVEFNVTATYNGKSYEVKNYSSYVTRSIEITADQAAKITTAIIYRADGTYYHAPTNVRTENGKYYADVNCLTNSTYVLIYQNKTFNDAEGKWYQPVVTEMASRGIIGGSSDGLFYGDNNITRAEFAAIIVRALGLDTTTSTSANVFTDINKNAWYYGAAGMAYKYGIVKGNTSTTFNPDANITRQEAMVMVQRAAAITGLAEGKNDYSTLTGLDEVSSWATAGVQFNLKTGLIQGGSGGFINATGDITRAETATVILRMMQKSGLFDVRTKA